MCKQKKRTPKPLDKAKIEALALFYVARYATSTAKLERYLLRKIRERGWEDDEPVDIAAMIERYVEKGYVDDQAFARSKSNSLTRRGYGPRRVSQALGADGIDEHIREDVSPNEARQRHSALSMAKKRRFGPFRKHMGEELDRATLDKQIAAMLRAGHIFDTVLQILNAATQDAAMEWAHELDEEWPSDDN